MEEGKNRYCLKRYQKSLGNPSFFDMLNPKYEIRNPKQILMSKIQSTKQYDLEDRTLKFARDVRIFVASLPRTLSSIEDGKQFIRSSGSVGANYIEANEALSKKDFLMRIKICRKEAKESRYWLTPIVTSTNGLEEKRKEILQEATELMMIFGSIIHKS